MSLWLLPLFFLFSSAWSFTVPPVNTPANLIHKADFIPAQEGFEQLRMPVNAMAASPQITFYDAQGKWVDACSSSTVSDSGNLLMAGHCLDACLSAAGAFRDQGGVSVVDRTKLASVACTVEIDGKRSSAKILATNDCHTGHEIDYVKMAKSGAHCQNSDFAIVQVQPELVEKNSCFHVGTRLPKAGDDVASVGYSFKSYRGLSRNSARDSNGKDQFISTGKVIDFRNSCDWLGRDGTQPTAMSFDKQGASAERQQLLQKLTTDGSLIQTYGAEFLKKGSGGGLVDPKTGELLGISSFEINNSQNFECRGSTFFSSTLSMLKALKDDYPEVDLHGVFSCNKNAFAPGPGPGADSTDRPRFIPVNASPAESNR